MGAKQISNEIDTCHIEHKNHSLRLVEFTMWNSHKTNRVSEYRITVVGASGTGKSAITVRFIQGTFIERYDPTVEDSYRKMIELDGKVCMVDVMDTAGQFEYSALRDQYMKSGEGFLIVYSITCRQTFEYIAKLRLSIIRMKSGVENFPMVLVGNKKHCEEKRQISYDEGKRLADHFGCPFLEISAKTNENVSEAFFEIVREIDRYQLSLRSGIKPKKKRRKAMCCMQKKAQLFQ